jgi:prepilin-type N-terminal cleavage/methylation domain-containing protein
MDSKAFTLIELLIVVAIIAILAAIAVPNFLEAQTRAKVSRAKADMRAMATAAETYHIDYNNYMTASNPANVYGPSQWGITSVEDYKEILSYAGVHYDGLFKLTSPVSYMSSLPSEAPFGAYSSFNVTKQHVGYWYRGPAVYKGIRTVKNAAYPREWDNAKYSFDASGPSKKLFDNGKYLVYDPTNGTVSYGGIWYINGASGGYHSFN